MSFPKPDLLNSARSRLLIVDVQEKLLPVVDGCDRVEQRCQLLGEMAAQWDIPVRVTEQYPKGLGPTVKSLRGFDLQPAEKLAFSAADASGWGECQAGEQRDQAIVCGIESHICVLQTAFELLDRGWTVYVVVDAIGARSAECHRVALRRMEMAGIQLVTTEMVLFEWAERAGSDQFKAVSKAVRDLA